MSQTGDCVGDDVGASEALTAVATVDSGTGATVLTVTGEVDMLTAPVLRQRIERRRGRRRS